MSTTAQRAMERLARSINVAFPKQCIDDPLVKAEALGVKGVGFVGTGIRLTIGDRTATFDENGHLLVSADERKAAKLVNPPPPTQARPGDFSKVDWGKSGMTHDSTKVGITHDGTNDEFKCSE